jgi:hypothetical protein
MATDETAFEKGHVMSSRIGKVLLVGLVLVSCGLSVYAEQPVRKLPVEVFRDKMKAG